MGFLDRLFDYGEVGRNKMRTGALPEWAQGLDLTNDDYNQILSQQAAWDYQSQEAEKARQWQEDYYKEFQSPSAMVEQYKQAGLNPMSIAGKVGGSTPPSASAPSASSSLKPSRNDGFDNSLLGIVQAILGLNKQMIDVDTSRANLQYQYDALKQQKEIERMKLGESARQADNRLQFDSESFEKTYDLNLKRFISDNELTQKQIDYIDSQIANLNADLLAKEISRQLSENDLELKKLDLKTALRQSGVSDRIFKLLGYDPNFEWSYAEQAILSTTAVGQQAINVTQENLADSAEYLATKTKAFLVKLFKDAGERLSKFKDKNF